MYSTKPPGYNLMNFVAVFWYRLLTGLFRNANEIGMVLTAFQKISKNTHGRLDLSTSIYTEGKKFSNLLWGFTV